MRYFGLCLWANGHEKETPFMKKLRLAPIIIGLEESNEPGKIRKKR